MLFCLVTCFFYSRSIQSKKKAFEAYVSMLKGQEKEQEILCFEKEQLQMKIASQTDPAWIEMILMRDLGMVPEGYLKVHFKNNT